MPLSIIPRCNICFNSIQLFNSGEIYNIQYISERGHQHYESQDGETSIGLYPFITLETSDRVASPMALPGFEGSDKPAAPPTRVDGEGEGEGGERNSSVRFEESEAKEEEEEEADKASDKQDDMDISEKSDSRSTSQASTKKSIDMDCTMTSDEEGEIRHHVLY